MGLLGILVCNLLKRKGYHCTAHKEVGPGPGGGGSGKAQPGDLVGRPEGPGHLSPAQLEGYPRGPTWLGGLTRRGLHRVNREGFLEVLHM